MGVRDRRRDADVRRRFGRAERPDPGRVDDRHQRARQLPLRPRRDPPRDGPPARLHVPPPALQRTERRCRRLGDRTAAHRHDAARRGDRQPGGGPRQRRQLPGRVQQAHRSRTDAGRHDDPRHRHLPAVAARGPALAGPAPAHPLCPCGAAARVPRRRLRGRRPEHARPGGLGRRGRGLRRRRLGREPGRLRRGRVARRAAVLRRAGRHVRRVRVRHDAAAARRRGAATPRVLDRRGRFRRPVSRHDLPRRRVPQEPARDLADEPGLGREARGVLGPPRRGRLLGRAQPAASRRPGPRADPPDRRVVRPVHPGDARPVPPHQRTGRSRRAPQPEARDGPLGPRREPGSGAGRADLSSPQRLLRLRGAAPALVRLLAEGEGHRGDGRSPGARLRDGTRPPGGSDRTGQCLAHAGRLAAPRDLHGVLPAARRLALQGSADRRRERDRVSLRPPAAGADARRQQPLRRRSSSVRTTSAPSTTAPTSSPGRRRRWRSRSRAAGRSRWSSTPRPTGSTPTGR